MSEPHLNPVSATSSDPSHESVRASISQSMTTDSAVRPSSPAKRSATEFERESHNIEPQQYPSKDSTTAPYPSPLPSRTRPSPLGMDDQSASNSAASSLSVDEQVQKIVPLIQNHDMVDGDKIFLIPMSWLNRLRSRTTEGLESHEFSKEAREGEIGPIDTRALVPSSAFSDLKDLYDGFGNHVVPLKTGLQAGEDYEFMPPEAWDAVVHWYGLADDAPVLTRIARNTDLDGDTANIQYELYPPIVTVQKVLSTHERGLENIGDSGKMATPIVVSRAEKYQSFLTRAKKTAGIDMSTKVRGWRIVTPGQNVMLTPEPSRGSSPAPHAAPVADVMKLAIEQRVLDSMQEGTEREELKLNDETMNEKYNGNILVASIGFDQIQTLVLQEQVPTSGVEKGRPTHETAAFRTADSTTTSSDSGQGPSKPSIVNKLSQQVSAAVHTRGRARKKTRSKGIVGLQNLGNTCYMNSALQCLRSVEELTEYFLQQEYQDQINYDNPLGSHGQVAKAYGGLIHSLYSTDSSFAPRVFKSAISRHYPTFQGYGQQDSQEFVNAVLDGLHEDLNQILKKPYIENPDSTDQTVDNADAIRQLGQQYQSNFRKRNESVIIDLFNGWYKNTLVCPACNKVSITFDPYSQVTLQLPVENNLSFQLTFFPLRDAPKNIILDIDKNASVKAVKEYCVQKMAGVKLENLVMAEEYNNRIYRLFSDSETFSESLQTHDKINVYEIDDSPTNWPPLDTKKSKRFFSAFSSASTDVPPPMTSPHADRMAVPVTARIAKGARYSFTPLHPFFVLITREEARDSDAVFRKVLAKLESMTTRDLSNDSEVSISPSDGKPSSDVGSKKQDENKVEWHSSDGEDSFVDVSINKTDGPAQSSSTSSGLSKAKSRILDPSYFIDPEFRNMFDLCVYSGSTVIPAGFTTVSETGKYTKLDDRMSSVSHYRPVTSSRASSVSARNGVFDYYEDAGSESASEDDLARSQHSMHDLGGPSQPESDDDAEMSTNEGFTSSQRATKPRNFRDRLRGLGKNMRRSKSRGEDYVLKLGESLVLDFNQEGYDQLFSGDSPDDFRGQRTDLEIPTLADPELDKKRERRQARRKAGVTLDECFDESSKSEVLSEDNAWYCNRCKEMRRATKTLELWSVPDILVVHLKRFASGGRFGRDKVDITVDFPAEGLDLNGRVGTANGEDLTYDLFAVDNHFGGLGGGHYTAYAKNFIDGEWYEYNDAFVSRASAKAAASSHSAYLLFYRRRSSKPLGSSQLRQIVDKAKAQSASSSSSDIEEDDNEASSDNNIAATSVASKQPIKSANTGIAMLGGAGRYAQPPVDEGLGMEDQDEIADDPHPSIESQSSRAAFGGPTWAWQAIGDGAAAPSNSVNGGNEDSDAVHGDDNASDRPECPSDDDRMKDFDDEPGAHAGDIGIDNEESEVHDINLDDPGDDDMHMSEGS